MGILCGCQTKAMLPAFEGHQAGQQAVGDVHIIAKVVVHVVCHGPETVGQLLGFNRVELSLIPLQALQLPAGRKERINSSAGSFPEGITAPGDRGVGCCKSHCKALCYT